MAEPAAAEPADPIARRRSTDKIGTGLDRRTSARLRRGELPIEARLDLHGMTQEKAHAALNEFVARCCDRRLRMVLIITGKGTFGGGVLKREVPRWLAESPNRARVLALTEAAPRHGDTGALYVLLRRMRDE